MIHPERIRRLNDRPVRDGNYVLYWMQASQRAECNHALELAIRRANELARPVVVTFGLTEDYPEANERHYAFMLEGLAETGRSLAERGIQLVVHRGRPAEVCLELAEAASLVVADRGYLRHQRTWRCQVARRSPCRVVQVETDVLVPAESASDRLEYAARTIRPRHMRHWDRYLVPLKETPPRKSSLGLRLGSIGLDDPDSVLGGLRVDRSVGRVGRYVGGPSRAQTLLREFLAAGLRHYAADRNDPGLHVQSDLSPYLHFGQISPLQIALAVRAARGPGRDDKAAFLEELLVRRELSVNFVLHNDRYDSWRGLPAWARHTLETHRRDGRPHVYSAAELEACRTEDPYWNAAMSEMKATGKTHGYMRMYWGKRVIEWTRSPRAALRLLLKLNNRYFLDGRDPNSYAAIAWCFGLHDRPWPARKVFGTVRSMTAAGLERKFDMDAYLRRVADQGKR